tara:strand:- start:33 stop:377 length:345 start_codon:yes stop_codon:yes gene_type:complete
MSSNGMFSKSLNLSYLDNSNKNIKYLVYFLSVAIILGYIVKDHMYPLLFFIIISGIVYYFNKNKIVALLLAIIITNLLIVLNFFNIREGYQNNKYKNNKYKNNKYKKDKNQQNK